MWEGWGYLANSPEVISGRRGGGEALGHTPNAKMTSKGYLRYSVSISVILSTVQGQRQATKGHHNQKLFLSGMWLMIYGYFTHRIKKIKAIDPIKINDRERPGHRSGHISSNFRIGIFEYKNVCSGVSLRSGFQSHFYFCARSRNAQNCHL